jgi:para-nitrobenzyl esterase
MTVDGYVLERSPYEALRAGENNAEAILHGYNAQEAAAFTLFSNANLKNYEEKVRRYFGDEADAVLALYPVSSDAEAKASWNEIYSAIFFTHGHYCWTRQAAALGIPAYEYFFTKTNGRLGNWHSGEEVYCYNNIPPDSKLYDESDRALADLFSDYFVNFIRTGDPNGEGLPAWERSTDGTNVLLLGDEQKMVTDPYLGIDAILDRLQGWEE